MTNVVASISANQSIPQRIVGNVSKSKDGTVSIEYKKPGMVKTSTNIYGENDSNLVSYMVGEAGFVVAMVNDPVAVVVGTMISKEGRTIVETEAGKVVINRSAAVSVNFAAVDEDSREAKMAARASKVKGVKIKKDKSEKKSKKDKGEKKSKSEKTEKSEKKSDKKKKRNKE